MLIEKLIKLLMVSKITNVSIYYNAIFHFLKLRQKEQTMAQAIEIFSAPDPDSRTKDHDGRRIDIIPGGWKILNRAKYRERPQDMDGSRAAYYREWRKKQKSEPKPEHNNNDVAQSFTQQRNMAHHTDIDKEIEIDKYKDKHSVHSQQSFSQFWTAYPKKIGKKAALKAWLKAKDKPPIKNIIQSIEHQKTSNQWQKENGEYIPLPTTWINQGRWDDDISSYSQPVQNAFTSCPKCGTETSQRD